jgi:enoyl-CoA hydratase/carnithine racemase
MGAAKRLMGMAMNMTLDELLEAEALEQAICMASDDAKEGIDAFLNKRQPNFK